MTYFVTFNAGGVLDTRLIKGIHKIPDSAIEVNDETWLRITQENDGVWQLGGDGVISKLPVEVDPEQIKVRMIEAERAWRDGEISRVSWLRDRHRDEVDLGKSPTLTGAEYADLLTYMQMLRDWPESQDFPEALARPVVPAWVAGQVQ